MKLVLAGFALLMHSLAALAFGTSSGGGGVGVRCFYSDRPSTIETLDLHEAKLKGLSFNHAIDSKAQAIELMADLLASHYFSGKAKYLSLYKKYLLAQYVEKIFNARPIDGIQQVDVASLPLSNDYGEYLIAPHCKLEQIAYLDDEEESLYIVRDLFVEMDHLNQAILLTHEMIYFLDRHYPSIHEEGRTRTQKTSAITRSFVGKLFSTTRPKAKTLVLEKEVYISCRNKNDNNGNLTELDIYKNNDGAFDLMIGDVHGHRSPFRIGATSHFDFEKIYEITGEFEIETWLQVYDYKAVDNLKLTIKKKAYEVPYFLVTRQGIAMGKLEELTCYKNNY